MIIEKIFRKQLENKTKLRLTSAKERIDKLDKIHKWILINRDRIKQALYNDFRKPHEETDLSEIYPLVGEIKHSKRNLKKWIKKKKH